MTEQEKAVLLQDVKNYLHITWNEEDSDTLMPMIERAISYFNSITNANIDFVKDGQNRQLLLDRCRYMRNHVIEEFEDNFRSEIINMQFRLYTVEEHTDDEI
ncbi:MAG: hypothetical protein ABS960_00655 [Solibacillus isronensis]